MEVDAFDREAKAHQSETLESREIGVHDTYKEQSRMRSNRDISALPQLTVILITHVQRKREIETLQNHRTSFQLRMLMNK